MLCSVFLRVYMLLFTPQTGAGKPKTSCVVLKTVMTETNWKQCDLTHVWGGASRPPGRGWRSSPGIFHAVASSTDFYFFYFFWRIQQTFHMNSNWCEWVQNQQNVRNNVTHLTIIRKTCDFSWKLLVNVSQTRSLIQSNVVLCRINC